MVFKNEAPRDSETARVLSLIDGYQSTCILIAATRLNLFGRLASGPQDVTALARSIPADGAALQRLTRALCVYGLVRRAGDQIELTDAGRLLLANGNVGELPILIDGEYLSTWSHLADAVVSGKPAFDELFGMSVWEHRRRNPALNSAFNRMVERPRQAGTAALLEAYDFSRFRSVTDVGGGRGYFLAAILTRFQNARGTLFDLPHVVADVVPELTELGNRCDVVGGSFFDDVPRGADLYVLGYVLHDWNDAQCTAILGRCRDAMHGSSRLLILEKVMPGQDDQVPIGLVSRDLHMLAVLGGRERTLEEYDALLAEAGLARELHTPTPAHAPDVLEARIVR
jgi:hypothetical protein